jgi:SAM-dependent methyltransferase
MIFNINIIELRQFYASKLGKLVRRDLSRAIMRHFHNLPTHKTMAGLGFAVPYLRQYLHYNASIIPVMFSHMGGMYWPSDEANSTVLAHENTLPFDDEKLDYVLLIHALEHSLHINNLMIEVARCLKPNGRALIIAPNRRGLWQFRSDNPFGSGNSFHEAQLKHRAELAGLSLVKTSSALFYPPSNNRFIQKIALLWEYAGLLLFPNLGGVVLMEFEKHIYAAITEPKKAHPFASKIAIKPQIS